MFSVLAFCLLQQTQVPSASGTAKAYLDALATGDFEVAASMVEAGIYSDPAKKIGEMLMATKRKLFVVKEATPVVGPEWATVNITAEVAEVEIEKNVIYLRKRPSGWRILVPTIKFDPQMKVLPPIIDSLTFGFTHPEFFIGMLSGLEKSRLRYEELKGIKQVGTAMLIWSGDHDDRLPKAETDLTVALGPYLTDKSLLSHLKVKDGVRWRLNPDVAGHQVFDVIDPSKTVMIYEEFDGKPGFGKDGRELIVKVDGSAMLATPEKLKKVIWNISDTQDK